MSTHNHNRHLLLMVLCCLLPIAALGAIFLFRVPVSGVLGAAIFLLCPLSHFLMMAFMRDKDHEHEHAGTDQANTIDGSAHEVYRHLVAERTNGETGSR